MNAQQKRTKFDRATHEQLQFYVNFCRKNPAMLRNRGDVNSKRDILRLWEEAAQGLNSLRGPTRTAKKWRDTFCMWRSQLMCRSRRIKALKNNKSSVKALTEFEKLALDTFSAATVESLSNNQCSSSATTEFSASNALEEVLIEKGSVTPLASNTNSSTVVVCQNSCLSTNPLALDSSKSTNVVTDNLDFTNSDIDIKLSPETVEDTQSLHAFETQNMASAANYSTQELFAILIDRFEQTENVNKNLANSLSKVGEGLLAVAKAIEGFTKMRHT